jgi:glycosyltransferase involved in cell wall biosynthesis
VYNRADLLCRAINSLKAQTFANWECLIVDDGSTDNTIAAAKQCISNDSRFVLLQLPHSGDSDVVNRGFEASKGHYLTILDSDDEYTPEHLELRVNELLEHPDIDMLHGGIKIIGDDLVPDKYDLSKKISLYDPSVYIGGTIFAKRNVVSKLHGFKKMLYAADSDFIERAIESYNVKRVNWPTYLYHRDHEDSLTKDLERNESKKNH